MPRLLFKFIKDPFYYSLLLIKKFRIRFHNRFEPHIISSLEVDPEGFKIFLWQQFMKNLTIDFNGCYYKTKVTNKNSPMVLSQARSILILCNNPKLIEPKFRSTFLIKKMTDYLISMRDQEGLFKFNQVSWDLQDEGIASVWATLAIIKAYEITNERRYLEIAISTMNSMFKNLYTKETSLIHTAGNYYWCLNSASTFAYVCSLLLNHHYSNEIKEAMNDSINLCLNNIAEDGHYPYSLKRRGTYLLLYHPIVIITLDYCLSSKYLDNKIKERLIITNKIARKFLQECIDEKIRIFEPEFTNFQQYIITNATTLLAVKDKIDTELEMKLYNNLAKFWKDNTLYLCKDKKEKLFDGDLYSVKDVLTIEVLYWLDLYNKNE